MVQEFCKSKDSRGKKCGGPIITSTTVFPNWTEIDKFCEKCGKPAQLAPDVIKREPKLAPTI